MKKAAALILTAALFVSSPGVSPYQAAAQVAIETPGAVSAVGDGLSAVGAVSSLTQGSSRAGQSLSINLSSSPLMKRTMPARSLSAAVSPNALRSSDSPTSASITRTIIPNADPAASLRAVSASASRPFIDDGATNLTKRRATIAAHRYATAETLKNAARMMEDNSRADLADAVTMTRKPFETPADRAGEPKDTAITAKNAPRQDSKPNRLFPFKGTITNASLLAGMAVSELAAAQNTIDQAAPAAQKLAGLGTSLLHFAPVLPLAYNTYQWLRHRNDTPKNLVTRSPGRRIMDYVDGGLLLFAPVFLSAIAVGVWQGSVYLPLSLALIWFGGVAAAVTEIEKIRAVVVGGHQDPHDTVYRTGPDGQLRNIRGNPIGKDRYDRYEPGGVTPGERLFFRAVAAWLGLISLLIAGAGLPHILLYNLLLTFLFILNDLYIRFHQKPPSFKPSLEDEAYARRFRGP